MDNLKKVIENLETVDSSLRDIFTKTSSSFLINDNQTINKLREKLNVIIEENCNFKKELNSNLEQMQSLSITIESLKQTIQEK